MEADADREVTAPAGQPAPGARLRAAREAAGIAIEAAATGLHLSPAQVQALEDDDHSAFPALIFVSGYVRNYARFLKLDPEPLLAMLEPVQPATPVVRSGAVTRPSRLETVGPVVWLALLLALIAGGLIWFVTREHAPEPPSGDAERSAVAPAEVPAPDRREAEAPGDFDAATLESTHAQLQAEESAEAAPPAPPAAPSEAVSGGDELVLRFSGVSWVEISDATGSRLLGRMGAPGEEIRLRGQAPFDILFGNAPSVTLEYNGKPYTNIRVNRRNVASFRLERPDEE